LNMIAKWLSTMGATHPWTVLRAQHLLQWVESREYEKVLQAPNRLPSPKTQAGASKFCDQCGHPLTGKEMFCTSCGQQLAKSLTR